MRPYTNHCTPLQGMNLPGARVELPAVTDQDKRDIAFAVTQKLDLIAASFIRNAAAVQEIRYVTRDLVENVCDG